MAQAHIRPDGGLPAVLLVHGFNGELVDMAELDDYLRGQGFATRNLLLPGHGTSVRHFARTGWSDWSEAVSQAAAALKRRHGRVVLVGHSMGGTLSLHTAARDPEIAGVAALCAPVRLRPGGRQVAAVLRRVAPYLPTFREDVCDPDSRRRYDRRAYRWTPMAAAHELYCALPTLQADLVQIRCPALIVTARKDHVVPMRDSLEIYRGLGTRDKELVVLERSYHVVTKDHERDGVFRRVGLFARRLAGEATRSAVPTAADRARPHATPGPAPAATRS